MYAYDVDGMMSIDHSLSEPRPNAHPRTVLALCAVPPPLRHQDRFPLIQRDRARSVPLERLRQVRLGPLEYPRRYIFGRRWCGSRAEQRRDRDGYCRGVGVAGISRWVE